MVCFEDILVYFSVFGKVLLLGVIVMVEVFSELFMIVCCNLMWLLIVMGKNFGMIISEIVVVFKFEIVVIKLLFGYWIELGGEMEDVVEVNDVLLGFMFYVFGVIFLLFVW